MLLLPLLLVPGLQGSPLGQGPCSDPHLCPEAWALQHTPRLRFDGSAGDYCYPDMATNLNNNLCKPFNSSAPIYYQIAFCGEGEAYMKLAWWVQGAGCHVGEGTSGTGGRRDAIHLE